MPNLSFGWINAEIRTIAPIKVRSPLEATYVATINSITGHERRKKVLRIFWNGENVDQKIIKLFIFFGGGHDRKIT